MEGTQQCTAMAPAGSSRKQPQSRRSASVFSLAAASNSAAAAAAAHADLLTLTRNGFGLSLPPMICRLSHHAGAELCDVFCPEDVLIMPATWSPSSWRLLDTELFDALQAVPITAFLLKAWQNESLRANLRNKTN